VKQVSLYFSMAIATLLSIGLVVGSGLYWWQYREFKRGVDTFVIDKKSKPTRDIDGKDQNILLVADDSRADLTPKEIKELHVGKANSAGTDVMMIIHVPKDGSKATVISLPRDSYVAIPGNGMNKLNAAWVLGHNAAKGTEKEKAAAGNNLLIETVRNLTGLTIDHYVSIGFIGFYRISEAVGPITVNICKATSDSLSGANFKKGKNTIFGVSALAFVRQRHGVGFDLSDIDRTHRQQYFLTAAFRKIASAGGILKLNDVFSAIKKSIVIDDDLDPLKLGEQMQALTANNIVSTTIKFKGFQDTDVGNVVIVDPAEVKQQINDLIGTNDDALAKAKTVDPHTVSVAVYNAGSGVDRAAGTAAKVLKAQGFNVPIAEDAPPVQASVIQYGSGMEGPAKTLAQYVTGAQLVKTDVKQLTLLLGHDGITAKALPVKPTGPGKPTTTPTGPTKPPTKPIDAKCIN